MKLTELKYYVDQLLTLRPYDGENCVTIEVKKPFTTVGGKPHVELDHIAVGFDWDRGKVFLNPTEPVMLVSDYDRTPTLVRELQEKIGWLEYELRNTKAENVKLKKKVGAT